MTTHTSSKTARKKRHRKNERIITEYMRILRMVDPERFAGERQREKHDRYAIACRAERVLYYQNRASKGLPLFDGSPWHRITTRQ